MANVNEAAASNNQFAAGLALGVDTISQNQSITFRKYKRLILPIDGTAFWVLADSLSPSAIFNNSPIDTYALDQNPSVVTPANTVQVKGSLHYTTDFTQDESEGFATNRVVFTSESEIEALNAIEQNTIYIGEFEGLKFAFSRRGSFYRQSNLFHYSGYAIYPAMETQIINSLQGFDYENLIVSNSLPVWLTLNQFFPMYPSYLVPDNISPPWCSVHITPSETEAMQATPYIDKNGSHFQLARDRVRLTIYGTRNFTAMDFVDYVNDYSINTDVIGIMNTPMMMDDKRTQAELNIIAQKKVIEYEVSYYQERVRNVARQYITSVFETTYPA